MIHIDSKRALILVVIGIGALNGPKSVLAEEADILDTLSSEQAVTVATGYEKPVNLAPAVATVITAEDIKRMGATTIEEALESVPGLHVSTVDAINSVTQIRGINSRLLVMVNNIPLVQGLLNAYGIKDAFLWPS